MIADLNPYPRYVPSGVDWLGSIPSTWDTRRLKSCTSESGRRKDDLDVPLLSLTRRKGIVRHDEFTNRVAAADDLSNYRVCSPGSLIMNRMQAWSGMFAISPLEGVVSPDYTVFNLRDVNPRFLEESLKSPIYVAEFAKRSKGVGSGFNRLYTDDFGAIPFASPPPEDQAAIVRFLNYVDSRIQRLIAAKERLIELLEEEKQAIIHRAVTRGLDPGVPLKASGLDWLGDVPEHWDVLRLKTLAQHLTSGSRGWSEFASDAGPRFVRIANLTRGTLGLDWSDEVLLDLPEHIRHGEGNRTAVRPGDLLLSITAFIGSVAVAPDGIGEAYVSQHVALCRLREGRANSRWIGYVLLSEVGQAYGRLTQYGGTKQGLSLEDVGDYVVLLPPRSEQDSLVRFIEEEASERTNAVATARREIALLREYRTRLISDVVTGELDVREAARQLPTDPECDAPELDDQLEEAVA